MFLRGFLTQLRTFSYGCGLVFGSCALILITVLVCQAQAGSGVDFSGSGGIDTINGRIFFPSGRRSDAQIKVSLESSNGGTHVVFPDHNGSFAFKNLEPGRYTVTVDSGKDYETVTESVYIDDLRSRNMAGPGPPPRTFNLPIYLQPTRKELSGVPGVIDARLSNVPESARNLYDKAIEAENNGDVGKAIDALKQALSLYPDFFLALNELGVQYLKLGQMDKAIESLTAAMKLAPDDFRPQLNYGIALLNQGRFAKAEIQLRGALKKNDAVPTAHMYLGIALAVQRKLEEAERELINAIRSKSLETGLAHRYLGGVYIEKRDYKRAADELEAYLKMIPNARDAEATKTKIREFRNKTNQN
ncbi:MAG: tetratricopeptide repeat protein [Pyrinomonadaceae bacterium]